MTTLPWTVDEARGSEAQTLMDEAAGLLGDLSREVTLAAVMHGVEFGPGQAVTRSADANATGPFLWRLDELDILMGRLRYLLG